MNQPRLLLCVLAHPDDESLGAGGTLAKYAAEGAETYVLTATRGQRGWFGDPGDNPGLEALGQLRETELRQAARELGVNGVDLLDYCDGDLHRADPAQVVSRIVAHIRHVRPHVVVTFGPDGAYGHPDHIAISQLTTTAVARAADADYCRSRELEPHRVAKLYYRVWAPDETEAYAAAFGEIAMEVDGVNRTAFSWPAWAITTQLDTVDHWRTVWRAVECHRTQLPMYDVLKELPVEHHERLWGIQSYYRALSDVGGSESEIETDLFAGLR